MKSKVELFNLALGRLGIRPLTGTEDARTEAVFCNQFFDSALEEVLDMGSLGCSLSRAPLARLAETPAFEFKYAYALPADFLHIVKLEEGDAPFCLERGRMLCNLERVNIQYVRKVSDVSELPPHVANCVALNLASKLATAVSNSPEMSQRFLNELYSTALPMARTTDRMQRFKHPGQRFWHEEVSP